MTATKNHKRVQAMTYAQAELLVNVDPDARSNSLPSGVQAPEGKKKGKCVCVCVLGELGVGVCWCVVMYNLLTCLPVCMLPCLTW